MSHIQTEHFQKALLLMLQETFESANGYYLDGGDSLFETLNTISAPEASTPVGGKCATLAAQVKHTAFYLDTLERGVREQKFPKVDWNEIWQTVNVVSEDEWAQIKTELHESYQRIVQLVNDTNQWPSEREIGGAIALITHSAYHLGEIRHALCTIR